MSYSIKAIGRREDVRAVVAAQDNLLPPGLRAGILESIDAQNEPGAPAQDGLRVEVYGHLGGNWGGVGKLEVEAFTMAKAPVLPTMAEPLPIRDEPKASPGAESGRGVN